MRRDGASACGLWCIHTTGLPKSPPIVGDKRVKKLAFDSILSLKRDSVSPYPYQYTPRDPQLPLKKVVSPAKIEISAAHIGDRSRVVNWLRDTRFGATSPPAVDRRRADAAAARQAGCEFFARSFPANIRAACGPYPGPRHSPNSPDSSPRPLRH